MPWIHWIDPESIELLLVKCAKYGELHNLQIMAFMESSINAITVDIAK